MQDLVQTFALWVSRASWQSITLVAVILLIQVSLGPRLPARWRHALWWIVVVKLLLPVVPSSPFSLFHFGFLESPAALLTPRASTGAHSPSEFAQHLAGIWTWVWVTGALFTLIIIFHEHGKLARAVVRQRPVTDPAVLDVLEDCKALMRIYTPLVVIETSRISSPALFGFLRPRLLLPRGTLKSLSTPELRHVFLHELAHLQRHDIAFGWLLAVAQALHWFNPVIWYALHRARVDRELATDELVLHFAQLGENRAYAETMIKLLGQFSRPAPLPAIAGILEDQRQMVDRIRQIARFGSFRTRPVAAAVLVLFLALAGLTGRSQKDVTLPSTAGVPTPEHSAQTPLPAETGP